MNLLRNIIDWFSNPPACACCGENDRPLNTCQECLDDALDRRDIFEKALWQIKGAFDRRDEEISDCGDIAEKALKDGHDK